MAKTKNLGILGADNIINTRKQITRGTSVKPKKGMKYYDLGKKKKKKDEIDIRTIKNEDVNKKNTLVNNTPNKDGYIKTNKKYGDYDYHDYSTKKNYDIYKKDNKAYYFDPKTKSYVDMDQQRISTPEIEKKEKKKALKEGFKGNEINKVVEKTKLVPEKQKQFGIDAKNNKKGLMKGKKVVESKKIEQVSPRTFAEQVELDTSGLSKKEKKQFTKDLIAQHKKENKKLSYVREGSATGELKNMFVNPNNNFQKEIAQPLADAERIYRQGKLNNELAMQYYNKMEGKKNDIAGAQRKIDLYNKFNRDLTVDKNGNPVDLGLLGNSIQNLNTQVESLKKQGIVATGGLLLGAGIGAVAGLRGGNPLGGAVAGAKIGAKAGYITGSTPYIYQLEAGNQYKDLLDMGVSDDKAKEISKLTGVINASIESGENIADLVMLGGGKLAKNTIVKNAISKNESVIGKIIKTLGPEKAQNYLERTYGKEIADVLLKSYGANIVSEGTEEALQETVGIAGKRSAANAEGIEYQNTYRDDLNQILNAAKAGAGTAALIGGAQAITTNTASFGTNKLSQMAEVINQTNNGEITQEQANQKFEQINDGTYQQNQNYQTIANQEYQNLQNQLQSGQITDDQYIQELKNLNETINITREQINTSQKEAKMKAMQERIQQMDVNGYISNNYTDKQIQDFMEQVYDDNLSAEELQDNLYNVIFKDSAKKQATNVLEISAKDTNMTRDEFIKRHYTKNMDQEFDVTKEDVGKIYDKYHKKETKKDNYEELKKKAEKEVVKTTSQKSGKKGRSYQGKFFSDDNFNLLDDDDIKLTTKLMKKQENQQKLTKKEEQQAEYLKRKREGLKNPELNPDIKGYSDIKADYKYTSEYKFTKADREKINKALDIVSANKQKRRTKQQWLDVANNIGLQSEKLDSEALKNIAFGSWTELSPNQKEVLNRQGAKYVPFSVDEWVKAVYKGAGVGTKIKEEKITNTQPKQEKAQTNETNQNENRINDHTLEYNGYYIMSEKPNVGYEYKSLEDSPRFQIYDANNDDITHNVANWINSIDEAKRYIDDLTDAGIMKDRIIKQRESKNTQQESYRDYDKKIRELEDNQYDLEEYIKDIEDYHSDNEEIEAEYQQELNEKKAELEKVNKELSELQERRETQYLKEIQRLPNPTQKTEFEGFSSTNTDFPFANEILNAKGEERAKVLENEKLRDAYVVEMTPKEYLENAGKYGWNSILSYEEISKQMGEHNQKNIDELAEAIKKGDKLPMPYLEIGANTHEQEGRHRAFAAEKAGLKTIPVLIMEKNTKLIDDTAPKKSENIPATKSENVISAKTNDGTNIELKKNKDNTYTKEIKQPKDNKSVVPKEVIKNQIAHLEDGTKLSNFYSNITEKSKFITEENAEKLSQEDIWKYAPQTNKETMQKALDDIGDTQLSLERSYSKFLGKETLEAEDIAKGWIFLKRFQDAGNYDAMVQVVKKMRSSGATKAGRTVQMFNLQSRLTPEGMLYYAQSELSEAEQKYNEGKSLKQIEKHAKDFTLTEQETKYIKDQMEKIQNMEDGREKNVEMAKINKMLSDKLPNEKGDWLRAWMRIAMLGNFKTQVRNIGGNAMITPVNALADVPSAIADKAISKFTGVRTIGAPTLRTAKAYAKGFAKGGKEAYQDYKMDIDTKDVDISRFDITQKNPFNTKHKGATKVLNPLSKVGNKTNKLLDLAMSGGDRVFYQGAYEASLRNQMILNNVDTPTQDMIDIARQEALSRTWNDNNDYTNFVLNTRRALNKFSKNGLGSGYGLGDVLIPFAKTPANLTKAIVDYSPVGLASSIFKTKQIKRAIETGQITAQIQHDFAQNLGKGVAGTMLYGLALALAKAGLASGSGDDDKDVANFIKNTMGIQPYSITINGKSFTYDWAQPIAAPLAIVTDATKNLSSKSDDELYQKILNTVMDVSNTGFNVLMQQSFLSGMSNVLNNQEGIVNGMMEQVLSLPARAVPTLFKQINDMFDTTQRSAYERNRPLTTAKQNAMAKTPASTKLAPQVDTLGREIKKYGGDKNKFTYGIKSFLSPANKSNARTSEVADEIYRLYESTGDKTIMPKVAPYYIQNKTVGRIDLSSHDRSEYQKTSGKIVTNALIDLINDKEYKKLNDDKKSQVVNKIVNYADAKAKQKFTKQISSYYAPADRKITGGTPIADYYLDRVKKKR